MTRHHEIQTDYGVMRFSSRSKLGYWWERITGKTEDKMTTFRSQTELLVHMANVQYHQGLLLSRVAESVVRIERHVSGDIGKVDPLLEKAIKESKPHSDALKKALDAQIEK